MAQILEITKEGALKTQIMYKANLSFSQLNDYIPFMLKTNLITQQTREGKGKYIITPKGYDFLQAHSKLIQLLKTELNSPKVEFDQKKRSS